MSTITQEFCVACGDDRDIRHEQQKIDYDVRGESITLDLPVKVCKTCGTIEVEAGRDPAEMAFAEYRSRRDLLTPQQICETRKRYRLSQRSLATLLGMSEATINRYEGGGLQDHAHDQAIRACQNLDVMRDLVLRRGDRLSARNHERVLEALRRRISDRRRGKR